MKKFTFFWTLILSLISCSFAESYEKTFARFADVARLDDLFNSMIDEQYLAHGIEQQLSIFGAEFSKDTKAKLAGIIREVFQEAKPEYNKYIFEVYKKYYSQDDLIELITFYTTPIGKKTVKLQGTLAKEGAIVGEQIMQKYQPLLIEKLEKVFESSK